MKKITAILLLCLFMVSFSFTFVASAMVEDTTVNPENTLSQSFPFAYFPEPPEQANTIYWIMGDGMYYNSQYEKAYNTILFVLYFPLVSEEQLINGEVTVQLDLMEDGQEIRIIAPSMVGMDIYCDVYRLNGVQRSNNYHWTMPSSGLKYYKFTFLSNYHEYWVKGNVSVIESSTSFHYTPLQVYWTEDRFLGLEFQKVLSTLNIMYHKLFEIGSGLESFELIWNQTMTAFINANTNKLNQILSELNSIEIYLDNIQSGLGQTVDELQEINGRLATLLDILGAYDTPPTYEDNTELNTNVDEALSYEQNNVDNFENAYGFVDIQIGNADSFLSGDFSSKFTVINALFQKFVGNYQIPFIFVLISLSLGAAVLVLGRRLGF